MTVKESAVKYQSSKKLFTYQDYLNLPADDFRYQLIGGELIMTPAPKLIHQEISKKIFLKLFDLFEKDGKGKVYFAPCDVYFDQLNVVQPDIFFVSKENENIITEDHIKGAPDLIIEILSPASAYYDLIEKKELYEKFGVKEYWIVDPKKKRIEIFVLTKDKFELFQRVEQKGTVASKILTDFRLTLENVFS